MIKQIYLIQPPPRASRRGAAIITLIVLLLSVAPFLLQPRPRIAFAAGLLFAGALVLKEGQPLVIALLAFLISVVPFLHPLLAKWPWRLLLPVLLFLAATLPFRRLRPEYGWWRAGRLDRKTGMLLAGVIIVSAAALVLWARAFNPDLSRHLAHIPDLSPWMFPLAGLAFSAGNATVEEVIFRGVYMQSFDSAYGAGRASILVQGWLFGAMHYLSGFPNGPAGLVLATAYGVMLGLLRRRSRGLLAPWLAHAGADLTIFLILLSKLPR